MLAAGFGMAMGHRLGGGFAPNPLLLDTLAVQPVAAFSERLINSAFRTGNSVRTRRSSDSTFLNTGFVNGTRDTAAITAFCGVGDGQVVTQFGQNSGTRVDITNAVATEQPYIVIAGVAVVQNGKPAIRDTGGGSLSAADVLGGTSAEIMLQVVSVPNTGSGNYQISFAAAVGILSPFVTGASTYYWDVGLNAAPNRINTAAIAVIGATDILTFISSVSQSKQELWRNGVLVASDATGHSVVTDRLRAYFGGNDFCHEILVFNSAAAFAQRNAITRNQGVFYGVTIP